MSFFKKLTASGRVYLDYAAATPVRSEVARAMAPYADSAFGNASSVHTEGREARRAVEQSRQTVADVLRVRKEEIFFTSGGTESNNLAIAGVVRALKAAGRKVDSMEIVSTKLEHPSVSNALAELELDGVTVKYVPVDSDGLIDQRAFAELLSPRTILVTFAYANSEVGVVQDVKKIMRTVREHRTECAHAYPFVHIDASQAPLYLPCGVDSLGVDLMTLDAGKCHGPKGAGVLMKKHNVPLRPLFFGGDQEGGLRPATENTALIIGCAEALKIAAEGQPERPLRVEELREYAFDKLLSSIEGLVVNGSRTERLANNVNISIPGIDGGYAVVALDTKGIAVSTKSACSGASGTGSKVVYAMGGDDSRALSTIRITLGEMTTRRDIDICVEELKLHVERMRVAMPKGPAGETVGTFRA